MKKISFFITGIFIALLFNACGSTKKTTRPAKKKETEVTKQTDVQTLKYIARYKKTAQEEMRDYGIPASITLAQGILESASGTSYLARHANNHFGIKCADDWNGPKIYQDDDHKNECFRKYKDASESFRDHSKFLTSRKRYAFLFRLPPSDYEAWAKGLKKAGYATDPSYPSKLIYIIEKYKLYELDQEVLRKMNIKEEITKKESKDKGEKIIYEVKAGETLYTISKKFNIPVREIKEMNNLVDFDIYEGQILVLKKPDHIPDEQITETEETSEEKNVEIPNDKVIKSSEEKINKEKTVVPETRHEEKKIVEEKPVKKEKPVRVSVSKPTYIVHKVKPQETLYAISTKYGVSIEEIMEANNLNDTHIKPGQSLIIPEKKSQSTKEVKEEQVEKEEQITKQPEKPQQTKETVPAYHIVKPGETLYRIHVTYNIPIEKLKELNGLKDNTIYVGQKIRLR